MSQYQSIICYNQYQYSQNRKITEKLVNFNEMNDIKKFVTNSIKKISSSLKSTKFTNWKDKE